MASSMTERHIRVHLPTFDRAALEDPTFVIVTRDGVVVEVSSAGAQSHLGEDETVVAKHYRARGATFADLDKQGHVQPRRGYRAREDRQ